MVALATCPRSGPSLGAVPATCFVSSVPDLYHYDQLRRVNVATMFRVNVTRSTLVLGGSQSREVLDPDALAHLALRRRRGGGGLVLLESADLVVDWWIPAGDSRWSNDVRETSRRVGRWWAEVLHDAVDDEVTVHEGGLEGDRDLRVVCFAGRGPGEVFVGGEKAVGVTQWRVREGVFVSSVIHASSSLAILPLLRTVPDGIEKSLQHHTLKSLGVANADDLAEKLHAVSGPSALVHVSLDG